jgi:hypothetical protein
MSSGSAPRLHARSRILQARGFGNLRAGIHGLRTSSGIALCSGCGKVADIHIIILLELLEVGHDILLDQVVTLLGSIAGKSTGGSGITLVTLLFQSKDRSAVVGKVLEYADDNGVGLRNVEADVGNVITDKV